jgi:hypothetical protein
LSSNPDGNLTPKQVEFARTIRGSGKDLLKLINDILDLSKIESGTVSLDVGEVRFDELRQSMERTFRHVAEGKGSASRSPSIRACRLPSTPTPTTRQVLKNLLSNAFKFTERGYVNLRVGPARGGWSLDNGSLDRAQSVLAFSVSDTGIGIPSDKQTTIFEAFQQADGSTSRNMAAPASASQSAASWRASSAVKSRSRASRDVAARSRYSSRRATARCRRETGARRSSPGRGIKRHEWHRRRERQQRRRDARDDAGIRRR